MMLLLILLEDIEFLQHIQSYCHYHHRRRRRRRLRGGARQISKWDNFLML